LPWAFRIFMIISELLQCHTQNLVQGQVQACLQVINHFRVL
jgi:hypothetical protein